MGIVGEAASSFGKARLSGQEMPLGLWELRVGSDDLFLF